MNRNRGLPCRNVVIPFGLAMLTACHNNNSAATPSASEGGPAVHVSTQVVKAQSMPKELTITGTLEPERRTSLSANASGRVTHTLVERGQMVKEGAILARLDVRNATLSAEEAMANLENLKSEAEVAKRDCERNEVLMKKGALSQQQYDKVRASCTEIDAQTRALEKRLGQATQMVSDGTIRAPFSGLVTERLVSVGDYVQASSPVVVLVVADPLRLKLTIPEAYAPAIVPGAQVRFAPTVMPNERFLAPIAFVSGEVRETTRDIVAEAIVSNPHGTLLPGMFVKAHLTAGTQQLPVIPSASVVHEGPHSYVFAVVDGHLEQHVVRLGLTQGDAVAVERGITAGEVLVLTPAQNLVDGARVE